MYKLLIKKEGKWYNADLPNNISVSSTFEEAQIAEMSLKGNGTQEIELPCTPNNKNIFEHIDHPQSTSDIAFRRLECRLLNDSFTIFGSGSYCVILRVDKNSIIVSIVGGSYDVFTALKNINFNDNPGVFGTTRRLSLNVLEHTERNGIIHRRYKDRAIDTAFIPLSIIKTSLEQQTGYTLSEKIFRDGYYLSLTGRKRASEVDSLDYYDTLEKCKEEYITRDIGHRDALLERYWVGDASVEYRDMLLPTNVTKVGLRVGIVLRYNDTTYVNAVFRFVLNYNKTNYVVSYTLNGKPSENGFIDSYELIGNEFRPVYVKYITFLSDGSVIDDSGATVISAQGFVISEIVSSPNTIQWGYNDYIDTGRLHPDFSTFAPDYPTGCYVCRVQPIIAHTNNYAEAYGEMNIANNLGYSTALDLYKALATTFAQITHVQEGMALTYSMNDVINNKRNAIDWTNKIVDTQDSFRADQYARLNHYALKEDADYGIITEKIIISPDLNLQESKTVDIAILSGNEQKGVIPYKYDEEGRIEMRTLPAPYLVRLDGDELIIAGINELSEYDIITTLLAKWRKVDARMLLSVLDIYNFDHRTPIYLRKYGAYFYVNKISEWEDGKICNVEMIKL